MSKDTKDTPLLEANAKEGASSGTLGGWFAALAAATPMLVLSYSSCVSYGQLIVADSPVSGQIVTALHLLGSGFTGVILPLTSRCPMIVPSADISVTIFYQKIVADIVAAAEGADSEAVAATVMLALPVSTTLMSIIFYAIGQAKLTFIAAYVPYSVVAGFLGTIGWNIFAGSFAVLMGKTVSIFSDMPDVVEERPKQLACALTLALSSLVLKEFNISARMLAMGPLVASISLFWIGTVATGSSADDLREGGWLFPLEGQQMFWEIWRVQAPQRVLWPAFLPSMANLFGLGMVLVLSLSLRTAGAEGSTGTILDMDGEMKWTGLANIAVGAGGGVIGSVSPGLVTFNVAAGSTDARASLLTGGLTLLLWLSGLPVMNIFPRFLLSGILMNLGLVMLRDWLWASRNRLGKLDFAAAYVQVGTAVAFGLLPGVLVGVAAACVSSSGSLLSLHALKYHVSGTSLRSHVLRTPAEIAQLTNKPNSIQIFGLEGYLGTGPVIKLGRYIKEYVDMNIDVQFAVLDLGYCQASDPSGIYHLKKLSAILGAIDVDLVCCAVEPYMSERLKYFGIQNPLFATREEALKYCEDTLLQGASPANKPSGLDNSGWSNASGPALTKALTALLKCTEEQAKRLEKRGSWYTMAKEAVLSTQGKLSKTIYLAAPELSEVTESLDVDQSKSILVALDHFGAICGVEGVLQGCVACSSVKVSTADSRVLALSSRDVQNLNKEDPEVFALLVQLSTERMVRTMDALVGWSKLCSAGGWQGATFDKTTAQGAMNIEASAMKGLSSGKGVVRWREMLGLQAGKKQSTTRRQSIINQASKWQEDENTNTEVAMQAQPVKMASAKSRKRASLVLEELTERSG